MNMQKLIKSLSVVVGLCSQVFLTACSLDSLVKVATPQTGAAVDHEYLDTRAGALELLYSSLGSLQKAVSAAAEDVGTFTDELTSIPATSPEYGFHSTTTPDTRVEEVDRNGVKGIQFTAYSDLQAARTRASNARYFLKRQNPQELNYAVSASYAYEGYAITMLAENLCSGVPLSTADYGKPAEYSAGLSTDSLYSIAVAKFDSALLIDHDSARFISLAKVGKARALLGLGRYSQAAEAVVGIDPQSGFRLHYTEAVTPGLISGAVTKAFWTNAATVFGGRTRSTLYEVINREGINGIMWYSNPRAVDPRLPVEVLITNDTIYSFPSTVRQQKFVNGNVSFELAGWKEARLIEAEALLAEDDPNWIVPINDIRRTVGLADTIAPAARSQQVDLLFYERAMWFYGEARRLSDMRRLVRQYGRGVNSVYPTGQYSRSRTIYTYGSATVFIPEFSEFSQNYKYQGCINRNP